MPKGDNKYRNYYDRDWTPPYNSRVMLEKAFSLDKGHVMELIGDMDEEMATLAQAMVEVIGAGLFTSLLSWRDVGEALGITRQSAYERFRGARQSLNDGYGPDEAQAALRRIGARRGTVMYEVRTPHGAKVRLRRKNPAQLLAVAQPEDIFVKVYPDGVERVVTREDVEAFAERQKRNGTKGRDVPDDF